jgi:hypothetical protein
VIDDRVKLLVSWGFAEYWAPFGPATPGCWYLNNDGIVWLYRHGKHWPDEARGTAGDAHPAATG